MRLAELVRMPRTLDRSVMREHVTDNTRGIHESVLRAYHILETAKGWLREGMPPKLVLELVEQIENFDAEVPR